MTVSALATAPEGVSRGMQSFISSAQRPSGTESSSVKYITGFFSARAVSISDWQLRELRAVFDWKNRTMDESRRWDSMFLGQSFPAGMPSSYQSLTRRLWSRVMVSSTSAELRWE